MTSFDPENWVIFSAGLLIGLGLTFIAIAYIDLDSRLQDLKIRTNKLTTEEALKITSRNYQLIQAIFLILVLLLAGLFLLTIGTYSIGFFINTSETTSPNQVNIFASVYNWTFSNILGIIIGLISGLLSTFITAKYVTKKQRAIQINDDLEKCLDDITTNKIRLTEEALDRQFGRIRNIVKEKRIIAHTNPEKAKELWAAFEKDDFDFSLSNYYQYLLVDNLNYFLMSYAHHYPKKFNSMKSKFRSMKELLSIYIEFNRQLQVYEIELLNSVNALIESKDFDELKYEANVSLNISKINQYYQNNITKINQNYSIIHPESYSEMEIHVSFFKGDFY